MFGFKRTIKQLDDRELEIDQKVITQPGQYIVLENEGMPIRDSDEKGRMYVKVIVVIPEYGQEALEKLSTLFD